jgi:hypothetical protein
MGKPTSTSASNRTKRCCRSRYWYRCGCIVSDDVLITRPGWPATLSVGGAIRVRRSPVGPLIHYHGTDVGLDSPWSRTRVEAPAGRPVETVGLGGLEEVTDQEGGRLIHARSQAIQSASEKWAR